MKKGKVLALILALAAMLTMALPLTAFAVRDPNGSIQITPTTANASVDGQTFKAFKIFDLVPTAGNDGFIYTLNPAYAGFETSYAAKLGTASLKDYILGMLDTNGDMNPARQEDLEDMARALWNWSETNGSAITVTGTETGVNFPTVLEGYYVVAGAAKFGASEAKTFAALCTVKAGSNPTVVALKGDAPSIKKYVKNDNNDAWEKWTDADITENVQFKLDAIVPNTEHYESYTYKVIDTMSAGIDFVSIASVIAYKGTAEDELTVLDGEYTFSQDSGTNSFTITVPSAKIMALSAAGYENIVIIYNAKLNENAVIESVGNPNEVVLKYSNDPNWQGAGEEPIGTTPKADAWIYTYKLDSFKYTDKTTASEGTPLAGVKFQLEDGSGNVASFTGNYVFNGFVAKSDPAAANTIFETDTNGKIFIKGLDAGNYIWVEYAALPGFNPVADIPVTIYNALLDNAAIADMAALITYLNAHRGEVNTGASLLNYGGKVAQDVLNVYNGKGSQFPGTGGMGVYIFYGISAVLTAGLVIFFLARRRKNILDAN